MGRRLMYYWTVLQRDECELVKKVYRSQKLLPVKNDWVLQLESELSDCGISLCEDDVKNMKKKSIQNHCERKNKKSVKKLSCILKNKTLKIGEIGPRK